MNKTHLFKIDAKKVEQDYKNYSVFGRQFGLSRQLLRNIMTNGCTYETIVKYKLYAYSDFKKKVTKAIKEYDL